MKIQLLSPFPFVLWNPTKAGNLSDNLPNRRSLTVKLVIQIYDVDLLWNLLVIFITFFTFFHSHIYPFLFVFLNQIDFFYLFTLTFYFYLLYFVYIFSFLPNELL